MKYIDYSEFKIIKEYQKICGKDTLSYDFSDHNLNNKYTNKVFHKGCFKRASSRGSTRKKNKINKVIERNKATLHLRANKIGRFRGKVFKTKLQNPQFDIIFRKHLRDAGYYKKKR